MVELIDWKGGDSKPARVALRLRGGNHRPKWDGSDLRPVTQASPENIFSSGSLASGAFASGSGVGTFNLDLGFRGKSIVVPVKGLRVTMKLAADGRAATEGIILRRRRDEGAGGCVREDRRFDIALCSGSTLDGIKSSLRQASESARQTDAGPEQGCDAVSIGLGFEAALVTGGDQIRDADRGCRIPASEGVGDSLRANHLDSRRPLAELAMRRRSSSITASSSPRGGSPAFASSALP